MNKVIRRAIYMYRWLMG